MSDQIILEFIGDPSGLRPAEEALKELNKATQQTIIAFTKANDAIKKFATTAKETKSAAKEAGEHTEKSVKSLSNLTKTINAGTVKSLISDFKVWAKDIKELTTDKDKLAAKLKSVQAELVKITSDLKIATSEYKLQETAIKNLNKEITTNEKEQKKTTSEIEKAEKANKRLAEQIEGAQKKMDGMTSASKESLTTYKNHVTNIQKWQKAIEDNNGTIEGHKSKITELGTAHEGLKTKLGSAKTELDHMGQSVKDNKEKQAELGAEAKKLQGEIGKTDNATKESTDKFSKQSKAAKESAESFDKLLTHTKKLVSSMGEISASIAMATGHEKEANKIREKTTQVISALTTAQSILKGATEALNMVTEVQSGLMKANSAASAGATVAAEAQAAAMGTTTVATEGATAATIGLDAALSPIVAIVALVAAGIAVTVAEMLIFYNIARKVITAIEEKTHFLEKLAPAVNFVKDSLQKLEDAARNALSWLTNGAIDDAKVHKYNAALEETAKKYEKHSTQLKKHADLLEAEGVSAEKVSAVRLNALKEERAALEARLKLEKDATKQQEIRDKLIDNSIETINEQKNKIENVGAELQKQGKTESEILETKKKMIQESINQLVNERKGVALTKEQRENYEAQLTALQNIQAELNKAPKETTKIDPKQAAKEALDSKKKTAELELEIAEKGSEQEKNARIKDIKAGIQQELSEVKKGSGDIALIKEKERKAIAEVENEYRLHQIQDEKTAIETRLINTEHGSQAELDLKIKQLDKEREAVNANFKLSATDREYELALIGKREDDLRSAYLQKGKDEKESQEKELKKLEEEALKNKLQSNKTAYDDTLQKDKEELSNKQQKIRDELEDHKQSFAQKLELNQKYYGNIDTELKKEKEALNDKYIADLDAAKNNAADLKQVREKYQVDRQEIEKKITDNKKEEEKKQTDIEQQAANQREEIAKKIGQKLIEYAKQISDAIFENQKQKRDNELKEHIDTLNARKDAELINTTLTASQRRAIEKKYKIEEAREKEKAWKADQKAKAEQAIINGLLAFTSALFSSPPPMNYVNAAIALASAGVQAGIIMSKTPPKFAKGVVALEGPGTETSDSIAAYLSKGESVITAKATRKYAPMLEAMNAGTFTEYMPIPQMPDVTHHAETLREHSHTAIERLDYERLGEAFARKVNLKQLNINLDEKGFSKSILSKGSRIESYNDKMKF